jgi:hypothetical protein
MGSVPIFKENDKNTVKKIILMDPAFTSGILQFGIRKWKVKRIKEVGLKE